jgi:hypothetical protein
MTQHVIPQHLPRRIRAKQLRERSPSLLDAYEAWPAARWCNVQVPTERYSDTPSHCGYWTKDDKALFWYYNSIA